MKREQPDIILITTDQQRYDATGPAAPSFMRAPHFDNIRREGVNFTSAYAECPVCVPSRVSIMTGRSALSHGMWVNGRSSDIIDDSKSLPSMMSALGYDTAAIGKMHFTPERAKHGFDMRLLSADYYEEMEKSGNPLQPMRHGLGQTELYPGMATVPECMTLTSWTAEKCVEYIRGRKGNDRPYMLWCSFSKPHPPFDPPEPYYSMYRNCPIPKPVRASWSEDRNCPEMMKRMRQEQSYDLIPESVLLEARAAYYGLITQIDYNMGRLFGALQDQNRFNDTLILYTSDHGEFLGDHRMGGKTFLHEASAHVPFVLRMPKTRKDRPPVGVTNASPVTFSDIMATFAAAGGGKTPDYCDGIDLAALARGEAEPRKYLEGIMDTRNGAMLGITDGKWKYMWFTEGGSELLFDVAADPHEKKNLAGSPRHAARKKLLKEELVRRHRARNSEFVKGDALVTVPLKCDSENDRRDRAWPGYHTEETDLDVKH